MVAVGRHWLVGKGAWRWNRRLSDLQAGDGRGWAWAGGVTGGGQAVADKRDVDETDRSQI